MSKQPWPGLFPAIRRFLYGEANPPKAKRYGETTTPTTSSYYEGMHRYYRWFRQDSFTRKCILTNAYFATMIAGYETALESTGDDIDLEDYVKENIDEYNKKVNMDLSLFVQSGIRRVTMTERLNKQLKVAGIVLELLSRGDMHWTPLTKAVLMESPTPWKVQSILRWLLDHGYIERPERGLYRITLKGLEFLRTLDPDVP
jgi:predicted transcriptional regulator